MKRVVVEELLDSDAGTPAEVAGSLQDLRMFNSCVWRRAYHGKLAAPGGAEARTKTNFLG